jgi:hypothetical protein
VALPIVSQAFLYWSFSGIIEVSDLNCPEKLLFFLGVGWKASDMLLIDNPYARIQQNDGKKRRKTKCDPRKMWSSSAGVS